MTALGTTAGLYATGVAQGPQICQVPDNATSSSPSASTETLPPKGSRLPFAHSSICRLWLVRAALVPGERITRAALAGPARSRHRLGTISLRV